MMGKNCTVRSRLGMMKSLSRTENAGVAPRDERTQKLFGGSSRHRGCSWARNTRIVLGKHSFVCGVLLGGGYLCGVLRHCPMSFKAGFSAGASDHGGSSVP